MKKTNAMNPVRAMMKPLPIRSSKSGLKAEQETALMDYLSHQPQSVCASDARENIRDFPGCDEPAYGDWNTYDMRIYRKRRAIINTFKRLESQGRIISTLFSGRRYYSIPVENGGEN